MFAPEALEDYKSNAWVVLLLHGFRPATQRPGTPLGEMEILRGRFDGSPEGGYARPMRNAAAATLVFLGGFIIMVLEIIGARFLAKDFGSSFHVWVSQIGVVLIALALGYYFGGALADRWQRLSVLVVLLVPARLWESRLLIAPN